MSIMEQGCCCNTCYENTLQNLHTAREKWNNGERNIIFKSYHYKCNDGCCDDYGTYVYVNGFEITSNGENTESVVSAFAEFLDIDNVTVDHEYDNED